MTIVRLQSLVAMVVALASNDAWAQSNENWTFSAHAYTYVVPDDRDYVQPTFTADRGRLHLEARYNYEDLDTGSAWVGYNFGGGEELAWTFTPMLGAVFGATNGVAPGFEGSLAWWKLELTSEGEHVFDADDAEDGFFYNWSELSMAATDGFRFGLAMQRTQVYETPNDVQGGVLVGFSFNSVDVAGYVFDPYEDNPVYVFAVGVTL